MVVESELAFGGARKVSTHDDLPCYVGAEDSAGGGHEEVNVLDDINERFVLAVLDVASSPGLSTGSLGSDAGGFGRGGADGPDDIVDVVGCNVEFEDVDICVLGVAEI